MRRTVTFWNGHWSIWGLLLLKQICQILFLEHFFDTIPCNKYLFFIVWRPPWLLIRSLTTVYAIINLRKCIIMLLQNDYMCSNLKNFIIYIMLNEIETFVYISVLGFVPQVPILLLLKIIWIKALLKPMKEGLTNVIQTGKLTLVAMWLYTLRTSSTEHLAKTIPHLSVVMVSYATVTQVAVELLWIRAVVDLVQI